jgi:Dolichyl-phosphate-mannose-protein mannosyltransferase
VAARRFQLALAAILLGALALRLRNIDHGLPLVFDVDEHRHFVRPALHMFDSALNPHYFQNPSALTDLFHLIFRVGFRQGFPFGQRGLLDGYRADPTSAFVAARVAVALIGTLGVWLVYRLGARCIDRRTGLVAAALLAVAFLPYRYSTLALPDVPMLTAVAAATLAALRAFERGQRRDFALAGAAAGLAIALKYLALPVLVLVVLAAVLRRRERALSLDPSMIVDESLLPARSRVDRRRTRRVDPFGSRRSALGRDRRLGFAARIGGSRPTARDVAAAVGLAVAAALAVFLVLNPYAVLDFAAFRSQVAAQARVGALLGQEGESGLAYYAWTLTRGLGWVPLAAAAGGLVQLVRADRPRALLLVAFPVALLAIVAFGHPRFYGRYLLGAYPVLCVLAAYGTVRLAEAFGRWRPSVAHLGARSRRAAAASVDGQPRSRAGVASRDAQPRAPATAASLDAQPRSRVTALAATAVLTAILCAQGLVDSLRVSAQLGRDDTRVLAARWFEANVPPGSGVALEPQTLARLFDVRRPGARGRYRRYPAQIPPGQAAAYTRYLTADRVERYRRAGFCHVVVTSFQKERALTARLRGARAYYARLAATSAQTVTFSPYRRGARPVEFSYDASYDGRSRAFHRPGPVVEIHRLRGCS